MELFFLQIYVNLCKSKCKRVHIAFIKRSGKHWNIYFHMKQQLQNIFFQTQMVWSLYMHQGFFGQLKLLNKQNLTYVKKMSNSMVAIRAEVPP